MTCHECDGAGFVEVCYNGHPDRECRDRCEVCHGSGHVGICDDCDERDATTTRNGWQVCASCAADYDRDVAPRVERCPDCGGWDGCACPA
jgi:RecJ-like exonuclease